MAKVYDIKKLKSLSKAEEKQLLQDAYDMGFHYERDYHGCAQGAFGALQELFGISEPMAFKAASGLAGGLGLSAELTCGAVTGACMFLSMLYGRERDNIQDAEGKRLVAYKACRDLYGKVLQDWGSGLCKDIQTKQLGKWFKLSDPEEFKKFVDAGAHTKYCPDVVGRAVRQAVEIILEKETQGK